MNQCIKPAYLPEVVVSHGSKLLTRHDNLVGPYTIVDCIDHLHLELLAAVHALEVLAEVQHRHGDVLLLGIGVVLVGVQHEDGVGEREGGIGVHEGSPVSVEPGLGEGLHQPLDEWGLARNTEGFQVDSKGLVDAGSTEVEVPGKWVDVDGFGAMSTK